MQVGFESHSNILKLAEWSIRHVRYARVSYAMPNQTGFFTIAKKQNCEVREKMLAQGKERETFIESTLDTWLRVAVWLLYTHKYTAHIIDLLYPLHVVSNLK